VVRDLQLWTGISLDKNINKKWELCFNEDIRFRKNMSQIYEINNNIGVNYELNKYFSGGINYRFIIEHKRSGSYEYLHRYHVEAKVSQRWNKWKAQYRARYQNKDDQYFFDESVFDPVHAIRNRISVAYDPEMFPAESFLEGEIYYKIKTDLSNFSKVRVTAGMEFEIAKNNEIEVYYRIDRDINVDHPQTVYIVGLEFKFEL